MKPLTRLLPVGWRILLSVGSVILLTLLLLLLHAHIQDATASLLYLLVVLVSATIFGTGPGLLASVLASLLLNYYFITPARAFGVTNLQDALRLGAFVIVALIASSLAGRIRADAAQARQRAADLAALYGLSQTIGAEVAIERILPVVARATTELLRVPACRILLREDHALVERASAGAPPHDAWMEDVPLRVGDHDLGILRLFYESPHARLPGDRRALLGTIAAQVVLVLERAQLAQEAGNARALAESDRLKSTLLNSVSHDLRTPLAIIKGAATNLLSTDVQWDDAARREMLATIDMEADRLNRLVGELLQMSRIEAGAIQQARAWYDWGDVIAQVAARIRPRLASHPIEMELADDLPPVLISYAQIDQALTNLLENAARYAPAGSTITIRADATPSAARVTVLDRGPGIPPAMIDHIFDKFVRAAPPERAADGMGLGLAICKGLIEAHGGAIRAYNRPDGGAAFEIVLPLAAAYQPIDPVAPVEIRP